MLCTLSWLPLKMPRARWPSAWLGVTSSPGFTLWRLFSVVVACAHRNCLYKLCSSFFAHRSDSKTITVNNMERCTMELRSNMRFSTLATLVSLREVAFLNLLGPLDPVLVHEFSCFYLIAQVASSVACGNDSDACIPLELDRPI